MLLELSCNCSLVLFHFLSTCFKPPHTHTHTRELTYNRHKRTPRNTQQQCNNNNNNEKQADENEEWKKIWEKKKERASDLEASSESASRAEFPRINYAK